MSVKEVTGYLCPSCGIVWICAKFAAECCGPKIETMKAYRCNKCTWLYKTYEDAATCTHEGTIK